MGTKTSVVRSKSLSLSPQGNVGFATHRPHAAGQKRSAPNGCCGRVRILTASFVMCPCLFALWASAGPRAVNKRPANPS